MAAFFHNYHQVQKAMTSLIEESSDRGILIVEDDTGMIEALTEFFKIEGFKNIYCADSGEKGLSVLEANGGKVYIIVLDLMLPGMNGIEFINHLVNVHKHIVGIIMITGYASVETEKQFYEMGKNQIITSSYIQKPMNHQGLINRIIEVSNLIHQKRMGFITTCTSELYNRLEKLEKKIDGLGNAEEIRELGNRIDQNLDDRVNQARSINEIYELTKSIDKKQQGFIAQLGLDVLRAILIALAVLSLLYLDFGNLFKKIISQ